MAKLIIVLFVMCINTSLGVIYELNESEYERMPPKYRMDEFETCLQQNGDIYCTVNFELLSDGPSDLLTMIHEYSKHTATHFNHSNLRYGLCVTQRCQSFYMKNTTTATKLNLELCLDQLFLEKYKLKTAVTEFSCNEYDVKTIDKDVWDVFVALIICMIVSLAAFGTMVDLFSTLKVKEFSIFVHFSLKRNWSRLKSPYINGSDPRQKVFKGLHGVRVIIFIIVVLGHSYIPILQTVKNTKPIEESYKNMLQYLLLNGPIIVQTSFVISGMLLVYKLQGYEEKQQVEFYLLPKAMAMRWLRLTPPYAVVLSIIATWIRFTKSGPLWEMMIGREINDCRQRGWLNLIYLNNYIYNSHCLPQTWYLAADTQLFCLGLILYLTVKKYKARNLFLGLAFFFGLLFPALHTYVQDLDALIILSPEESQTFFGNNPTYNEVYKGGHTNIASYVIGLSLGYLIVYLQKNNFTIEKYKKYRFLYWAMIPACCIPMFIGSIFYRDAPRESIFIRVLFATFAKPFFGLLVALLILGMVFKYENVVRGIVEWDRWLPLGRLSYCAFIVHLSIIRLYTSIQTKLMLESPQNIVPMIVGFIVVSYIIAIPLWLLVEAPTISLTKYYLSEETLIKNEKYSSGTDASITSAENMKLKTL